VEQDYLVHAKTHLSLGDTADYVDTIFKWVGGANKGAFIGAVLGDYGQGKTSFLVHVWAQSRERQVFVVPPFEWTAFEEIVDAMAGWVDYVLGDLRPDLAQKAQRLYREFRQQTLEDVAQEMARRLGRDYEQILDTVQALFETGRARLQDMSASRLLDYMASVTELVMEAGYSGLLMLLDEPEVAAKNLGNNVVQHFIFDLADELHRRQGNYGIFLSMPDNFYSSAQRNFSSLTARLEVRKCFPRLRDIYGSDFAEALWNRYVQEFDLGNEGRELVSDLTLRAIGQVGSSQNRGLAYGPRTVISIFARMVDYYRRTGREYKPQQMVDDVLDDEVLVTPEYRTKILEILRAPDINDENREAIKFLAAYPSGVETKVLRELEFEECLRPLSRTGGLVTRTAFTMKLRTLQSTEDAVHENELRRLVEEIDSEYAPDRRAFENAIEAFVNDVLPIVFPERQGQQLTGWQSLSPIKKQVPGAFFGTLLGAFPVMSRHYPCRAMMVLAASPDATLGSISLPPLSSESGPQCYDLLYHFVLRWHDEQPAPAQAAEIHVVEGKPGRILINLDLHHGTVEQDHLAEMLGAERLTPLWTLNLLRRMEKAKVGLGREDQAELSALREMLLRQLVTMFFGQAFGTDLTEAAKVKLEEPLSGSGLALLDQASNAVLAVRYPDYQTLIRQPHWQTRLDSYINALNSSEIPLACKRGREVWKADGEQAGRILGASRMNLSGGAFEGFDSLIQINSRSKNAPLEITFKIHPLEQELRDYICSQETGEGRKLKRNGKECWFVPQVDLLPFIQHRGYTLDELHKIIDIGRARGSYDVDTWRRGTILYCAPIEIPELQGQLRNKLAELVEEIEQFKSLPDYTTRFDPEEMSKDIDKLADDADYEHLMSRMNKEFEQNHNRLPGYFDRAQEEFKRIRARVTQLQAQVTGSRDIAQLRVPASRSPWANDLERYIVPNLQQQINDVRHRFADLVERIDAATMKYVYSRQRPASDNIKLVREAWATTNELEINMTKLHEETRTLLRLTGEFSKWIDLLRYSDGVYERLSMLRSDPAHAQKARDLDAAFDGISESVSNHIALRNTSGLAAYEQFHQDLQELDQKRQGYWTSLKSSFDQQKGRVNQIFSTLRVDGHISIPFNPEDVGGSYQQLFTEGARLLKDRAWNQILGEIGSQERELVYARDVLRAMDGKVVEPLLIDLQTARGEIATLYDETSDAWLRGVAEAQDEGAVERLSEAYSRALEAVRTARQKVNEVTRPTQPTDARAQTLNDMIAQGQRVDLKELVLGMMSEVQDGSQALNMSLEALAELFRHNCVQISVERRQR